MCSLGENILAVHKAKTADASRLINKSICDTMKLRELPKACKTLCVYTFKNLMHAIYNHFNGG